MAFARGWVKRRINPPKYGAHSLATDGSWPNLGWYARHSQTLKELWQSPPPATRQAISRAWGSDPWSTPLPAWSDAPADLFRILTLASHLNRRRAAV
jgi:asparagine synthase (glutamine-hydrolysing)